MAFRSSNRASSSVGVSSIDVPQPSGVATGDVVVCAASNDNSSSTITLPTSCTALASSPQSSTFDQSQTACGTKAESGSPPANYTFLLSTPDSIAATVAAFSGVSGLHTSSGASTSSGSGTPISPAATGVTTSVTCDLVFVAAADWNSSSSQSYTAPSGYTEREDVWSGGFPSITLATKEAVGSGSTGTVTGTAACAGASGGWMAFLVALASTATPSTISRFIGARLLTV